MAERRLRLLMNLPPTDGKLLRPKDEPIVAKINFDWPQVTGEATTRRAELRRQKWQIRRRELELMASKNYLLPRLDGVGRYRWRGFGDDLFPIGAVPPPPDEQFDGAYSNLTSGNFQEWQLGFELSVPIGFRQAHVAARNAELMLARERAILRRKIRIPRSRQRMRKAKAKCRSTCTWNRSGGSWKRKPSTSSTVLATRWRRRTCIL
jgi:outer membrane protein TolC